MSQTEVSDAIDPKQFWRALGPRAIGGAVVAAAGAQGPAGFLALSATHLAQNPPTMIVTIGKTTSALATVLESKSFAINYFSTDQQRIADLFGGKTDLKGADRFEPGVWTKAQTGAPILKDAVGWLDCRLVETIERYKTIIAIGVIVGFAANANVKPLVYFQGGTL
jgi:flavin reductase (DIM6/NTAB) family NADH-FMN oxidoreductase RutF